MTSYAYDNADRLTDLQTTVGVTTTSRFQYTLDRRGQRTAVTETRAPVPEPQTRFAVVSDTPALFPIAGALGDVNADGRPDLALAQGRRVGLLLGHGDGTFQDGITVTTTLDARAIALTDLNDDTQPDLLIAEFRTAEVLVLLGNGDGTFQPAHSVAVGGGPHAVVGADLNSDMIPDLVTANAFDDTVSVVLGYGDGTFQPAITTAAGASPRAVAVGDLNGDTRLDLAVTNHHTTTVTDTLSVLLGNGDGTLQAAVAYLVDVTHNRVHIQDLTGNGVPDLVTTAMLSDTVYLLPGNGDGTFQGVTTLATVPEAYGLEVADVTTDGVADLVVTSLGSGAVTLLVANEDGTVQPPALYPTGDFPWSVTVGDVTGDSLPDLVVPNRDSGTVRVLRNQAAPPRTISYTYDGLQRLTGATETPGTTYAYTYDLAGNRTEVWENGAPVANLSYNDANQVIGWSYDAAGNLLSDGTTTRSYDALNRLTQQDGTSYTYNGDGVLVSDGTTTYAQDLAAPLSQVLNDGTANYVYGHDRLRALGGPWYVGDALGSVRQTLDDAGAVVGSVQYDPWGVPTAGTPQPFGFTGELHSVGQVYLRARWYDPTSGTFLTFRWRTSESNDRIPGSHHPYVYALNDPITNIDPTGKCVPYVEEDCLPVWELDQGLNWRDGQQYVQTAIVDPVVGTVKPTWDVITDAPGAREQVRRGAEYLVTHPVDSAVTVGEGAIMPFTDIYEGITCRDMDQLGRGLTGYAMILGGARLTRGRAAPIRPNTLTTLRRLAQQADQTTPIPPGTSAHVAGTLKHTTFARLVRGLGRPDLTTEVIYRNGRVFNRNVRGSVRLDVVEGPLNAPTAIYDLKTGAVGLSAARIQQIRNHLPNGGRLPNGQPIPVIEVRP